jgi:hypothetical protein
MRNRWNILFACLCILVSSSLILLCLFCSPAELIRYLGIEHAISPAYAVHIKAFRLGALIAGFLIWIWSMAYTCAPNLLDTVDKWFEDLPPRTRNLIALSILLALACACYLPFTYHDVFAERDTYRMLSGLLDSLNTGTPYANSTLYGRHHSFGYYGWLYLFSDAVQKNTRSAFALFNYTNTITAISMVIPLFFVVRRFWGFGAAIYANIVLMIIPVWWQMSLYGHPQSIAVFFNFVGLAFLCYRSRLATGKLAKAKAAVGDLFIIAAFSLSLMNRLDGVLMYPLILAVMLFEEKFSKFSACRLAAYTLLPIFIFIIGDAALPAAGTAAGSGVGSTLKLVWRWHNPTRLMEHFRKAIHIFFSAYPGFLIFAFLLACFYLIRTRKYASLFFILPVVLINYIFWMPSPWPARHFVYMSAPLSIGIAILMAFIARQTLRWFSMNKLKTYAGVLFVFLFAYLSTSFIDGVPFYTGVYLPDEARTAGRFGQDLMQIPQMEHPIFVVSDAIPVIVNMQLSSDSIRIKESDHHTLLVNNGKNDFVFCVQGWKLKNVSDLYKKAEKSDKMQWLVDPYNYTIYSRMKDFQHNQPRTR